MFDTVLIAGLGLMGGSMAKTIKARTLSRVLGWNRTRATAEQALADGSIDAIEGITSPDGRVFGKMGHSERYTNGLYLNVDGDKDQKMFAGAVSYFRD